MLRGLGFLLIAGGLCALLFPSLVPLLPLQRFNPDMVKAGGIGVMAMGVFLWWPSRD